MGQVSSKLRRVAGGYAHWCPGCGEMHSIAVEQPFPNGARWTFDGNFDAPTFSPSVNITTGPAGDGDPDDKAERCHYFLRHGHLQFCGDSTHVLAGQTVPLPDLPPHVRDAF